MPTLLLFLAALAIAFANGANDNFKGVATLYGGGTVSYRAALTLATTATLLGSLMALSFGSALVTSFSGKGLVPDAVATDPAFLAAIGCGATGTVLLATRLGLPISTTHALIGALLGAGLVKAGSAVSFERASSMFLAPLLLSPAAASALASVQYPAFRSLRKRLGITRETCLCVGEELIPITSIGGAAVAAHTATFTMGTTAACTYRYEGRVVGINADTLLTGLHCASAAVVSFARGMNDAPKIVALLLAARIVAPAHGPLLVGLAMAIGGLLGARRVAETMSHEITTLNPGQALTGNLATALLVLSATRLGLPVSTTHMSVGALAGIGWVSGQARWKAISRILVAWVTTLPAAAMLGAASALILR